MEWNMTAGKGSPSQGGASMTRSTQRRGGGGGGGGGGRKSVQGRVADEEDKIEWMEIESQKRLLMDNINIYQ